MSKRQDQNPRTELPPFWICLFPDIREVHVVLSRTPAPSIPPLAMGTNAGEEEPTLLSPTNPALPCFARPLVGMPLPWGAASLVGASAPICQMMTSAGETHRLRVNTKQCWPWAWESQPTLEGRGMIIFAQAGKLIALSSPSSGLHPNFILSCLFLRALTSL